MVYSPHSVQGVSVGLCPCSAHTVYREYLGSVCRTVLVYSLQSVKGVYRECLSDCVGVHPSVQGVSVGLCWCTSHTVYKECIRSVCRTVLVYSPHSVQGVYREWLSDCVGVQPTQCQGSVCRTVLVYIPHSVQGVYKECLSDCVGVQPTQCTGSV